MSILLFLFTQEKKNLRVVQQINLTFLILLIQVLEKIHKMLKIFFLLDGVKEEELYLLIALKTNGNKNLQMKNIEIWYRLTYHEEMYQQ